MEIKDTIGRTKQRLTELGTEVRTRAKEVLDELRAKPLAGEELQRALREVVELSVSSPSAVEVRVQDGVATVRGSLPSAEARKLLWRLAAVPGLRDVKLDLSVHDEPNGGSGNHAWSTGRRAAAVLGGGALATWGAFEWNPLGLLAGAAGLALVARGVTNR